MSLLIAWLAFPLVCAAVCGGWGLLVERACDRELPGVLLVPIGLAPVVVVSQLLTVSGATAELACPVAAIGGVAGLVLGRERLRAVRPDPWLVGAALVVFGAYAAPIVLSGEATFAGYGVLGDTAVHFVAIDWLMSEGRTVTGGPSTYQATLAAYMNAGYPTGAQSALGALRPLSGQDVAWVFAPFLAFVMALASLALVPLVSTVLDDRRARAGAVALAGVPSLAYAYTLEGSIKEVGTIWVLALLGALIVWFAAAAPGWRRVLPVALASAAALAVISLAVAPWLGPLLLVFGWLAVRRGGRWWPRAAALEAGAFAVVALLLALPALTELGDFVDVVGDAVTAQSELGNLLRPLVVWQALPAWPRSDFRLYPDTVPAWIAVGVGAVAVALGVVALVRRGGRGWPLALWLAIGVVGWAFVTARGGPWADAKALAIAAPGLALLAALGPLSLWQRGARLEGAVLAALLAGGVCWTVVLAGHGAVLAPRDRLSELQDLGPRLEGHGPTLYPQFEEYAKHFLRQGVPDSPADGYKGFNGPPVFRPGLNPFPLGLGYDLDDLDHNYVRRFRSLVVRRGPGSRPPAIYRRVWRGSAYELWERAPGAERTWIGQLPIYGAGSPSARPDCSALASMARDARGAGARLIAAPRRSPVLASPARAPELPRGWRAAGGEAVLAPRAGSISVRVTIPRAGRYDVWLGGVPDVAAAVAIDGRWSATVSGEAQAPDQKLHTGRVRLTAGPHTVTLRRGSGDSLTSTELGPVFLDPAGAADARLLTVAPSRWRSLCSRELDWVQAVVR